MEESAIGQGARSASRALVRTGVRGTLNEPPLGDWGRFHVGATGTMASFRFIVAAVFSFKRGIES
jgi:hypothetical protein